MRRVTSALVLLIVLVWGCKPNQEESPIACGGDTQVTLKVKAVFAGEPFVLFQQYENVEGFDMSFDQVRLYLSDISLIQDDGTYVSLTEIEFFNLDGEETARSFEVPSGAYSGMVYHIGVPTELNGTDNPDFLTSQYGQESPLNVQNGMYWNWQNGYRFSIYDGRIDGTPDNPDDFPSTFSYHLGKDQFYTEILVESPFTIDEGENQSVDIVWDLGKNVFNANDTLKMWSPDQNQFHGAQLPIAARFQDLMRDAFITTMD